MAEKKPTTATAEQDAPKSNLPAIYGPRLPFHPVFESKFGIDKIKYTALVNAIFPTAQSADSVFLALSYCQSRNLDVFKRNVHIVPIWDKKQGCLVDTIWPGIGELRTTAFRTGEYAGRGDTKLGSDIIESIGGVEVTYPEWAQVVVFRMVKGMRVEFWGPRVYWIEAYAVTSNKDPSPNAMWRDRPRGQLEKCAEAAALRAAFPEEIGGDICSDEVGNRKTIIDTTATNVVPKQGIDQITEMLTAQRPVEDHSHDAEPEVIDAHADETPEQNAAGIAIAQLKNEITKRKRKGEFEGLLDDLAAHPDWEQLRNLGLLGEATIEVRNAMARCKVQ